MKCRVCHRELRNPESIRLGIGPVCDGREGSGQGELFDEEEEMEGLVLNEAAEISVEVWDGLLRPGWFFQLSDPGPPTISEILLAEIRASLSEVRALCRKLPDMAYSLSAWETRLLNVIKKAEESIGAAGLA